MDIKIYTRFNARCSEKWYWSAQTLAGSMNSNLTPTNVDTFVCFESTSYINFKLFWTYGRETDHIYHYKLAKATFNADMFWTFWTETVFYIKPIQQALIPHLNIINFMYILNVLCYVFVSVTLLWLRLLLVKSQSQSQSTFYLKRGSQTKSEIFYF